MVRIGRLKEAVARMAAHKEVVYPLLGVLGLCVAFAFGWGAHDFMEKKESSIKEIRLGGYRYINPLLECEVAQEMVGGPRRPSFERGLEELVARQKLKYNISEVAIYYRDLNNGPWIGIDEDKKFAPASLLKIPVMMAWLKQMEADPTILHRRLQYKGGEDLNAMQNIKPSHTLVAGQQYTVEDLLQRSIVYSDNNANNLLYQNLNPDYLIKTYADLGIEATHYKVGVDILTPKDYGIFFRVLFNSSYLKREYSEMALWMLSQAEYRDGLVAGVPRAVSVSHKFGERVLKDGSNLSQLHDCGIVYYPGSPYLLCVMTRGTDFGTLDDMIRDVSRLVFEEVDKYRSERQYAR